VALFSNLAHCACIACAVQLLGQAPLQVGTELPGVLDLRSAAAADWVPSDARDPRQVEAMAAAWTAKLAPLQGRPSVRILLPAGPGRITTATITNPAIRLAASACSSP